MMDEYHNPDESIFSYLYRTAKLPSTDPRKPDRALREKLLAAALEQVKRESQARIELLRACGLENARLS